MNTLSTNTVLKQFPWLTGYIEKVHERNGGLEIRPTIENVRVEGITLELLEKGTDRNWSRYHFLLDKDGNELLEVGSKIVRHWIFWRKKIILDNVSVGDSFTGSEMLGEVCFILAFEWNWATLHKLPTSFTLRDWLGQQKFHAQHELRKKLAEIDEPRN
ncbi:MAG: hypothetical protein V4467_02145 [Patescibacteria group bacterium]